MTSVKAPVPHPTSSQRFPDGEALGQARGLRVDWAKFADAWRGLYQPQLERVRSGAQPWTKLDDLHRAALDQLLIDFKITGLSESEVDHLNRAWHRLGEHSLLP